MNLFSYYILVILHWSVEQHKVGIWLDKLCFFLLHFGHELFINVLRTAVRKEFLPTGIYAFYIQNFLLNYWYFAMFFSFSFYILFFIFIFEIKMIQIQINCLIIPNSNFQFTHQNKKQTARFDPKRKRHCGSRCTWLFSQNSFWERCNLLERAHDIRHFFMSQLVSERRERISLHVAAESLQQQQTERKWRTKLQTCC